MVVDLLFGLFIEILMFLLFVIIYWVFFGFEYSNLFNNDVMLNIFILVVGIVIIVLLFCFIVVVRCIMYLMLGFF